VAAFVAPLSRDGPGLLLRDLLSGEDEAAEAALAVIGAARADVLLVANLDWDLDGAALGLLAERLAARGLDYPHRLALRPNAGRPTGLDMDGDGRLGSPRDAQGYGRFNGDGGMALLSRWPLGAPRDLSGLLWRDLPGARMPRRDGAPYPSQAAQDAQRLSTTGHWVVPVEAPGGPLTLLAWAATPPVFDGPEDMNGRRAADELALWLRLLDGSLGEAALEDGSLGPRAAPESRFVLVGLSNMDPLDGEGLGGDMAAALADPRLQDPQPHSEGGRLAADAGQRGDPGLDTADWPGAEAPEGGPGNLRVTYVLPSADWRVLDAGVLWPAPAGPLAEEAAAAGPHRLVWVDLAP
jgi:hypothetical protein